MLSNGTTYPTIVVNGVAQAYCPACPNGVAPWAANQRVIAGTTRGTDQSTNLTVRLIPYNAEGQYTDRVNQLDLKIAKTIGIGRVKVAPTLEMFNVFNADPVILQRSDVVQRAAGRGGRGAGRTPSTSRRVF